MEQTEMEVKKEIDITVGSMVEEAVKSTTCYLNSAGIVPKNAEEAYGITAHAQAKIAAVEKGLKKQMKELLETLDTGLETNKKIAEISTTARMLAIKAIQMAAETENIIRSY